MFREFSNRFGVLMSRMAVREMAKTIKQMKVTKRPDNMGTVVKPTQSMAGPNLLRVELSFSWS